MYGAAWAVLLMLAVAPATGPAGAEATPVPAAPAVDVLLAGDPERRDRTREVLTELLSHLEADIEWSERETLAVEQVLRPSHVDQARVAHVHVDLVGEDAVMIYVADRAYARILVRPVPLADGYDEVAREQVGAIVASAVEALIAGAEIGISRRDAQAQLGVAPPPEPPPAPAPAAPEPTPTPAPLPAPPPTMHPWLALGFGYGLEIWRPESIAHGPSLRLSLGAGRERLRVGGFASVRYLAPQTVGASVLPTRVTGVTVRAGATVRGRVAPRVALFASLGLGNDLLWTQGAGGSASWTPIPMLELSGGPGVALGRGLRLDVEPSIAVDLVNTRILTQDDIVVLDPWRARPGLRLRLAWDILVPEKKSTRD